MWIYFSIGWLVFLLLFYTAVWFEYAYYRYNLPAKFRVLLEAFTEEDEEQSRCPGPHFFL